MSSRNSFVTFAEQVMKIQNNALSIMKAMTDMVSSNSDFVTIETEDLQGNKQTNTFRTVGYLESELQRLQQTITTLTSLDQRGAIIQPAKNQYKKIIVSDLNKEPAPISEVKGITNFVVENNHFFGSLLSPLLKVRLDLSGKVGPNVRKVLTRRYVVSFMDSTEGQQAIVQFNDKYKNKTNIDYSELENWLVNTPGIAANKNGDKITYDEQENQMQANRLQYEGFFTIVGSDEDTVSRKQWYLLNTLDYTEIDTNRRMTLRVGDELIINSEFATTRYRIIDINTDSSDVRVRFDTVEGMEAPPISIVAGLKFYSQLVDTKKLDISIGFNEYNVIFVKPINADTNIVARKWSAGNAFYTNDLKLSSTSNNGDNGRSMSDFYINTVNDFGEVLNDVVTRQIPRSLAIKPDAPLLDRKNFRVVQVNKHLTDSTDIEKSRKNHEAISNYRSQLDEINKTIAEKRKEQYSKSSITDKDRVAIDNQITKLTQDAESISLLLSTASNAVLANAQNDPTATPKFRLQGFWGFPGMKQNGSTRLQTTIGFRVQYKYASKNDQENNNEVFKIQNADGTITSAAFSQWNEFNTPIRERLYNEATKSFEWAAEDLANIDKPNANSLSLSLHPHEKIIIRVKSISEVGYPDSILESEWSNVLDMGFPDELIKGKDVKEIAVRTAELEKLKSQLLADLERKNIGKHLSDSFVIGNRYFAHSTDSIGVRDANGEYTSLTDRLKRDNDSNPTISTIPVDFMDTGLWSNFGGDFEGANYHRQEGKVYVSGVVRVENPTETDIQKRFPDVQVDAVTNSQYSVIGVVPEGYRPTKTAVFTVATSKNRFARVDIQPNGNIVLMSGYTGFISLTGIVYVSECC